MAVIFKCKSCDRDVESDKLDATDQTDTCPGCQETARIVDGAARLISRLLDFLPANPDGPLQIQVDNLKHESRVARRLSEVEEERAKASEDLPGMVPALTGPELRARELADAQDQKGIVSDVVKDRERNLGYAMKEGDLVEVNIKDSLGNARLYTLEKLEKIKTNKNPN